MKFSFSLVPTVPLCQFSAVIRRAEEWGYDHVWVPDQGFLRDPFVTISHVATVTSGISLGVGVTNPYSRHPMQIARAAATLADLRQGQIVLGLGAGEKVMRNAIGAPQGDFVETARAAIIALKALFAGERVETDSTAFTFADAAMEFTPIHPVPIYLASTHPDAFRLAGELADGVIVGDVADEAALRDVVSLVEEGARRAGRRRAEITVVAWVSSICVRNRGEADHVRMLLRENVVAPTVATMHKDTRRALGIEPERAQAIRQAFDARQAPSADLVPDALVDRLALVGTSEECIARIRRFQAVGVDMMGLRMPVAITRAYEFAPNIERLAQSVLPSFR